MAGGGSLTASLCGMGYAALLGVSAGWLWGGAAGAAWLRCSAPLPLGWALAQAGTESLLIKYGQAFSALQFLLSEDRAHYARGAALWLRFALAHGLLGRLGRAGLAGHAVPLAEAGRRAGASAGLAMKGNRMRLIYLALALLLAPAALLALLVLALTLGDHAPARWLDAAEQQLDPRARQPGAAGPGTLARAAGRALGAGPPGRTPRRHRHRRRAGRPCTNPRYAATALGCCASGRLST